MAITPFIEAPFVRTVPQPVSGGIGMISTTGDDMNYLRQGVSIRTQAQLYSGMMPKFFPEYQRTPNGEGESTVYGQPAEFRPSVPYCDLQKFNAVIFMEDDHRTEVYPQILRNVSLLNPYQLDGAIEPLTIREAVSMMSIEGSDLAHSIKVNMSAGNPGSPTIVQIYDYRVILKTKPFIDFPEYMGSTAQTAITKPGIISGEEPIIQPFVDTTFMYRLESDSSFREGNPWEEGNPLMESSASFDVMLRSNQVSAAAGFIYENNPLGTDSLAFGGLKK